MCEKEERVEHIVQKIDAHNESKGHLIRALNDFKNSRLTEEERKEKARRDNEALFGPE